MSAQDVSVLDTFRAHATGEAQATLAALTAHVCSSAPAPVVPAQIEFFAVLLHALPAELSLAQEARLAVVYDTVAASLRAAHGSLSWMAAGQAQAKSAAVWRVCRAWLEGLPPIEFAEFVAEMLDMLAPAHYDLVAAVAPGCGAPVGQRAGAWAATWPDAFAAACREGLTARLPADAWPCFFVAASCAASFENWAAAVRVYSLARNATAEADPKMVCAGVARIELVAALGAARCYAVARTLSRCCGELTADEQEQLAAGSPGRRVGLKTRR